MSAQGEYSSEERIQQLSEQVKLQVGAYEAMAEVYEKYSLALARIMELLRQLHDTSKEANEHTEQYFTEIITCVTVVDESIKHAEAAIRLDNSVFTTRFNEFIVMLEKILSRIDTADSDIADLQKSAQKFHDSINQTTNATLSMVQDLHKQNQKQLDFWKRWRVWLYAFIGIVGILETMIQFGVLKLTWFN